MMMVMRIPFLVDFRHPNAADRDNAADTDVGNLAIQGHADGIDTARGVDDNGACRDATPTRDAVEGTSDVDDIVRGG